MTFFKVVQCRQTDRQGCMKATSIYLAKAPSSILVGEEEAFIFINNGMRTTENQELDFPPFQDESSAVHKKQIKIVKNVIYLALQICTPPK